MTASRSAAASSSSPWHPTDSPAAQFAKQVIAALAKSITAQKRAPAQCRREANQKRLAKDGPTNRHEGLYKRLKTFV